ncbi:GFA family protein [Vibrio sp. SCSIO 43135]|uniref:GFA family protein n=1 Tax=Vibrio sp. SCSIO 43135 TaxID=2819096 RepID=UPI0020755EE3|nr:GFA family protein [Vibrio sp. SCSIO 43135]USD42940.1 GFA family protein [Vibrio sp. SCSIO 43135]
MEYPIQGACQCGQVSYQLKAEPKMVIACHCTECQKLATSPYSVTAIVATDSIEFTGELKEWQRMAESGNKNCAAFCPECGNRVYHYNPDDMSTLKLKLKPVHLEDASLFEPQAHVWVSEKLSWVDIPEGVKTFPKQP